MTLAPLLSALHARSRIDEALEQVRSHAYIERAAAASDVDALAALEKSIAALLAAQDTDACAMGARAAALYVARRVGCSRSARSCVAAAHPCAA